MLRYDEMGYLRCECCAHNPGFDRGLCAADIFPHSCRIRQVCSMVRGFTTQDMVNILEKPLRFSSLCGEKVGGGVLRKK